MESHKKWMEAWASIHFLISEGYTPSFQEAARSRDARKSA